MAPIHNQTSYNNELPKKLITHMRTLFDILDDKKTGYINIKDIESRWNEQDSSLPKGFINSLKKVMLSNEKLNFELLCEGLKLCLLNNKTQNLLEKKIKENVNKSTFVPLNRYRPASVPLPLVGENRINYLPNFDVTVKTTQRPSSSTDLLKKKKDKLIEMPSYKAMSMPHLRGEKALLKDNVPSNKNIGHSGSADNLLNEVKPTKNRTAILDALEKWYNEKKSSKYSHSKLPHYKSASSLTDMALVEKQIQNICLEHKQAQKAGDIPPKKPQRRNREMRRHTLANGVDFNMLKRIKQLEQEREVLLQGLEVVERAREWCHRQLGAVEERIKSSRSTSQVQLSEERLNFQRAQIAQLNKHLSALLESSDQEFPLHMNLALPSWHYQAAMARNQELTKEVTRQSEAISQLQREKASLIRELFQARSTHPDSTFM